MPKQNNIEKQKQKQKLRRLQDTRSTYKNQLYFYTLRMTTWTLIPKIQFIIGNYSKNGIDRGKYIKTRIELACGELQNNG